MKRMIELKKQSENVILSYLDLGESDGATLKVESLLPRYELNPGDLQFNEDGNYTASVVSDNFKIPEYYTLHGYYLGNVLLVDDMLHGVLIYADEIKIYRAGSFGCYIQLFGDGYKSVKRCNCEVIDDLDDFNPAEWYRLGVHAHFDAQPVEVIL